MSNATKKYKGCQVRKDLRLAIYLRDHFTCIYCLRDLHDADPTDITLDHIKCASKGGDNDPSNLITACRHCNCKRQDQPVSRFAGAECRKHITRNTRRSIKKYRKLAKAILTGDFEDPRN